MTNSTEKMHIFGRSRNKILDVVTQKLDFLWTMYYAISVK
jgi:hypothetical protein